MAYTSFLIVALFLLEHNVQGYKFQSEYAENMFMTCEHNRNLNLDVSLLKVYFYDFKNNNTAIYPITTAVKDITDNENWDPERRIAVFMPGFISNLELCTAEWIRDAFRHVSDTYLVMIDFSAYTSKKLTSEALERAIRYVYYIGRASGLFLAGLKNKGLSSKKIQVMGHSLGGQLLASLSEAYLEETGEKIWRVTSIDPASPCFNEAKLEDRIRAGIAEYVEVYHCTDNFLYGVDVDFFLNSHLKVQPDCYEGIYVDKVGNITAKHCSHIFCVKFWTDSVLSPEIYAACDIGEYVNGTCRSHKHIAGYFNSGDAKGKLYASTETFSEAKQTDSAE